MEYQEPAEGVLKRQTWGDCKFYSVYCECGNEHHMHDLVIEADEAGVNIELTVTPTTDYWSSIVKDYSSDYRFINWVRATINSVWRKLKLTWDIWTKGYVKYYSVVTLNEQAATNYAHTLLNASKDVKEFVEARKQNKV